MLFGRRLFRSVVLHLSHLQVVSVRPVGDLRRWLPHCDLVGDSVSFERLTGRSGAFRKARVLLGVNVSRRHFGFSVSARYLGNYALKSIYLAVLRPRQAYDAPS